MESQFYQINILQLLLKWKFHLGIIVVIAIILAAVFSGPIFITPKFESRAVVYPANISPYSEESETEQMLQIFQSNEIRDNVIRKFDLAKHWGIDSSYKYFYTTMMWEFSQNIKIGKTPYEGVSIEVMDKDPVMANDIVNAILDFYNSKVSNLHETKFDEVVKMYERALREKSNYIDSLENRFFELSTEYGLLDYTSQSREIARGYLKTIDGSGSSINSREVERLKENIEQKGGEFLYLQFLLEEEAANFAILNLDYERAKMDADRQFSYVNVINKPFVADKKAYPVRWLIVVITALASFFIAFLAILIIENYKGLTKKA
jgi:capsule polysaccharide export protein KpsE/RkpR